MAAENQISRNVNDDPLYAKLLEIIEHVAEVNLKCDVCKNDAVVILCTNCSQCLCKACYKQHSEENSGHDTKPLDKASFCPEHKKCFEYYCTKCDEFVCSSCKEKHDGEGNHNVGVIEEIASNRRSMLAEVAEQIDPNSETLSQIKAKLVTAQKNLEEQLTKLQQSIDNQYEAQFEKLKGRCDLLKKELSDVISQQKEALLAHLEEVKSTQNEAIRVKKLFDDLRTTSDKKVISTKEQIMELQIQKITNQCTELSSKPIGSGLIMFHPATKSVETLGQLFIDAKISNLPEHAIKGETIEFLISTQVHSQVSVKMTSSTGEVTTGEVRNNNDGSYTVSIKIAKEVVGEVKLSAYIDGLEIKGSPSVLRLFQAKMHLPK